MTLILKTFKPRSTVNLGLHLGAISGNIGWVKYALDNGQPIDSIVNGLFPIHAACSGGNLQVVEYLIERGSDVNARRRSRRYSGSLLTPKSHEEVGLTPLHFAAANGSVELVELLISKGGNPNSVDKYGSTPLSIALAKGNFAVAMLLHQYISIASTNNTVVMSMPMKNCQSTFTLGDNEEVEPLTSKVEEGPKVRTRRRSLPDVLFSNKANGDRVRSIKNFFRKNSKDAASIYSNVTLGVNDLLSTPHPLEAIPSYMSTPS